jgi:hypothetical protein
MDPSIYRVLGFKVVGDHIPQVKFEDGLERTIELEAVLEGEVFGSLRDPRFFVKVELDPENHTLVWPNDAVCDPETLHDWPKDTADERYGRPMGCRRIPRKVVCSETPQEGQSAKMRESCVRPSSFEKSECWNGRDNAHLQGGFSVSSLPQFFGKYLAFIKKKESFSMSVPTERDPGVFGLPIQSFAFFRTRSLGGTISTRQFPNYARIQMRWNAIIHTRKEFAFVKHVP